MPEPLSAHSITVDPNATSAGATHLLYDGDGGWIEAKRVWLTFPDREIDGAPQDGWGWEFKDGHDVVRWLRAPEDDDG